MARRLARPPALPTDQAVERYFVAMRVELTPDPLFRRRARGAVLNRFVAAREGILPAAGRRGMGRLGRAVLHASLVTAVFASSVLAASQEALPGDLLYPLKLQIEELRVHALPADLHDDLAAHVLTERIREIGALVERGEWAAVEIQTAIVRQRYQEFVASTVSVGGNSRYGPVLSGLLERLPESARVRVAPAPQPAHAGNSDHPNRVTQDRDVDSERGVGPRATSGATRGASEKPSHEPRPTDSRSPQGKDRGPDQRDRPRGR